MLKFRDVCKCVGGNVIYFIAMVFITVEITLSIIINIKSSDL